MQPEVKETFLALVRWGIGYSSPNAINVIHDISWHNIQELAVKQGLSAIVLDGVNVLRTNVNHTLNFPNKVFLIQWIGEVLQSESINAAQHKAAAEIGTIFHQNNIRTYVLKGDVIAECYPNPSHRSSVDMDCYLHSGSLKFNVDSLESVESSKSVSGKTVPDDVWEKGNRLIEELGYEVKRDFYKNSTFYLPGLTVENHKYFTPFRGNKKLEKLEIMLQSMMKDDKCEDRFEGVWLFRPPVMVTALFLIEHAYSHFLHEGLTWRHVLDWKMFSRKHKNEIDWNSLDALIDDFGFRKFYDSYNRLGMYALEELPEAELTKNDKRMLEDVWSELDLHDTTEGFKGKLNLVGNTLRAWWKYHYFSDISMLHALWIQTKGVLFIKNPKLN